MSAGITWSWGLLPFALSALLTALCAVFAWQRKKQPGAQAFAGLLACEALWSLGYTAELAARALSYKVLWDDVQLLAMVAMLPLMLTFLWDYRARGPERRWLVLGLLMVVPLLTLGWVASDSLHGLARASAHIEPAPPFGTLLYEFTSLELLTMAEFYALTLYMVVDLTRAAATQHQVHRTELALIVTGWLLPTVVNTVGLYGFRLLGQRDMAPACFGIGAIAVTWALYRGRFLELAPVARHVVFAQLPEPVLVLDPDARVIDLNPSAEALLCAQAVCLGRHIDQLLGQGTASRLQQLGSVRMFELTVEPHVFEVRSEPLEARRGKQRGRVVLLRDITLRKQAELALSRVHEALERRVEERTRELGTANEAMVLEIAGRERAERERAALKEQLHHAQKLESIGRLAGGIAHDFNNLLTVILGQVELAIMAHERGRDVLSGLHQAMRAGHSAAELTRQLLAFARKQPTAPRVLSINETVEQTHRMLMRLIGEDVRLSLRLGDRLAFVRVDPGQLEQVLLNLTVNARDAMPGGGELSIQTDNVEVEPATLRAKGLAEDKRSFVRLRVADGGMGISPEVVSHIFEPFFTTKGLGKGTGIGLATVYGIVSQADGFIEVDSKVSEGSTFDLYFPASDTVYEEQQLSVSSEVPTGHERVVLVEDQRPVRELLTCQLEGLGYQVVAFSAGEDALSALASGSLRADLLITDVVLAGINGPTLVRELRSLYLELKVLYVSGYTNGEVVSRGLDEAAEQLLFKPFTLQQLAQSIRGVLEGRRS